MKKLFIVLLVILVAPFLVGVEAYSAEAFDWSNPEKHNAPVVELAESELTQPTIRERARASSVHVVFHHPVFHAYYAKPPPKEVTVDLEFLEDRLDSKFKAVKLEIKKALEKAEDERDAERHETWLTTIEKTVEVKAQGYIPLGVMAPEYAKFPEKVLAVWEAKPEEVDVYLDKYKKDVQTISEVTGVSLSKAKDILLKIKGEGYTIYKPDEKQKDKMKLIWFTGWADNYPTVLKWAVTIEGEPDINIITGYDPRGILEIKHVPDDLKVLVKAGYHDLKETYKTKPKEETVLSAEVEELKRKLKEIEEKNAEKPKKRDIRNATWSDVRSGLVKLELLWMMGHGTGIYLGNMGFRFEDKAVGYGMWNRNFGHSRGFKGDRQSGARGVILTNAHVAVNALNSMPYLSKDLEHYWYVYAGKPFVRYTVASDHFGSPATVLTIDAEPVVSWDFDTGIMITSPVQNMEPMAATFGNSDNVKTGTEILMVGNPSLLQKYSTQGIISQRHHSFTDSIYAAQWFKYITNKPIFNWLKNTSMWFESTGYGGTSGSGVWALNGPEAGKLIALHNAGLAAKVAFTGNMSESKTILAKEGEGKILKSTKFFLDVFEKEFPVTSAKYTVSKHEFDKTNPKFPVDEAAHIKLSGLNAAIPINLVVQYLRERGLEFGRELGMEYFSR